MNTQLTCSHHVAKFLSRLYSYLLYIYNLLIMLLINYFHCIIILVCPVNLLLYG